MVGKVYLQNESDIDVPIPDGFVFRGNDKDGYKMDKGNFLLEVLSEEDPLNFGQQFLNLPSADKAISGFKDFLNRKEKK